MDKVIENTDTVYESKSIMWVILINVLFVSACFTFLYVLTPDWRGLASLSLLTTPLLLVIFIRNRQWREYVSYSGICLSLSFAFFTAWAPASILVMFSNAAMLGLLFLNRKWVKWLLIIIGALIILPLLFSLSGFQSNTINLVLPQIFIFSTAVVCMILNGYVLANQHHETLEENRQAKYLVLRMQEVYLQFEEAITATTDVKEMCWLVVDLCIPLLGLEDCVIYILNKDTNELEQVAAYGPKSYSRREILSPLKIPLGKGIVGKCAAYTKEMKINDLNKFTDYIPDDKVRQSELAMPIVFDGKVYGVIDSEHSQKGYFTDEHLILFRFIASLCAGKIGEFHLINTKLEKADAQRALNEANQLELMRNTFLNNLSHDLRTPLSLIKGPLQELLKSDQQSTKETAEIGLRNADRLNDMVSGLLEMHKLERGALQLRIVQADISQHLSDWYSLFSFEAKQKGLTYELHKSNLQLVECDVVKIGLIVQNLLSNAFKFTPNNGIIRINCELKAEMLIIEVHDSGIGIQEKEREKIFERFYKVNSSSYVQGTGLGLAIVAELTDLMLGEVKCIDGTLKGSSFQVKIPVSYQSEKKLKSNISNAKLDEKPLIIIIEDNPEMRQFIIGLFNENYHIIEAADAEQGWELILQYIPDLIITDLMLPGMNGEELCHMVKTNIATDHLPVLALSAKHSTKARVELYSKGADNYLIKPFDTEELLGIAASLIEQRQKMRQKFTLGDSQKLTENGMSKINDIINSELDNSLFGPRQLEKEVGLNRNQLQKKIKSITGFTPVEYIRVMRLEKARKLLKMGVCNVSEAAYQTGFNQVGYFSLSYKQYFGHSPSQDMVTDL